MTRSVNSLVVVALTAVVFIIIGGVVTAASTPNSGTGAAPTVVSSGEVESETTGEAFGTNVSVPPEAEAFHEAEREFYSSRTALEDRSESLEEIAEAIETDNAYTDENHERSTENLNELDNELEKFRDAETNARNELMTADLSSTEQFLILESIDKERNSTEAKVDDALGQYEEAVQEQRNETRSTLLVYFGGALFAGLLGGVVLGAVVPLVEAKKTANKMKLSRNISYKKRAGLVPVGIGLVILVGAVGLLGYLGALDLIRVII